MYAHTTVAAKHIRTFHIVFVYDNIYQLYDLDEGALLTLPPNPTKANHRFDGWFENDVQQVANAEGMLDEEGNLRMEGGYPVRTITATRDMTLTGRFVPQVTVGFYIVQPGGAQVPPSGENVGRYTIDRGSSVDAEFFSREWNLPNYIVEGWYGVQAYVEGSGDGGDVFEIDGQQYVLDETSPITADTALRFSIHEEALARRMEIEGIMS